MGGPKGQAKLPDEAMFVFSFHEESSECASEEAVAQWKIWRAEAAEEVIEDDDDDDDETFMRQMMARKQARKGRR